jgi:hypothetical protein
MSIWRASRSRYVLDLNGFAPYHFGTMNLQILQTEAWQMTIGILQSGADAEAKLFAATTLKGKVTEL